MPRLQTSRFADEGSMSHVGRYPPAEGGFLLPHDCKAVY